MKIAFLIPSLENRGPVVFTKYLINSLKGQMDDIVVYYFKDSISPIDMGVECKKISLLEKKTFDYFDIVHSTQLLPDIYIYIHKKSIIPPVVSSMHNLLTQDIGMLYGKLKGVLMKFVWKFVLNRQINLIVSSDEMFLYYEKLLNKNHNKSIIPYGIKKSDITEIPSEDLIIINKLRARYKIVGSVGLLIKRKGFSQLIDLLYLNKDIAVILIGDGEEKSNLEAYAKLKGVSDRFFILGFRDKSFNFYKYFDLFAMVSYSEGFGLAMLEAMSQKIPIICSNLKIYNEYHFKNYLVLFEPGDMNSLFCGVNIIINDINNFKERSFKLYEKYFTLEKMGINHIELYQKIINNSL